MSGAVNRCQSCGPIPHESPVLLCAPCALDEPRLGRSLTDQDRELIDYLVQHAIKAALPPLPPKLPMPDLEAIDAYLRKARKAQQKAQRLAQAAAPPEVDETVLRDELSALGPEARDRLYRALLKLRRGK